MARKRSHNEALAIAERYGFHLVRVRKHMVWRNDTGAQVVCPSSSSDWRSLKNFEQQCRRSNALALA